MTRGVRGQRRQELPDSVHGIHDTDAGVGLNQKGRQVKELPEEQNSKGNPHNDPPEEDDVGVSSHPSPLASDPPSVAPTDEPVEAPTDVPVEAPVEAPTDVPVEVPVEVPSLSPVILTAPTGNDDQPPREEVRAEANYIVAVNNDVAGPYDYAKDLIFGMDELSQQVAQRDFPEMFTIRTPTTLLVVGPTGKERENFLCCVVVIFSSMFPLGVVTVFVTHVNTGFFSNLRIYFFLFLFYKQLVPALLTLQGSGVKISDHIWTLTLRVLPWQGVAVAAQQLLSRSSNPFKRKYGQQSRIWNYRMYWTR